MDTINKTNNGDNVMSKRVQDIINNDFETFLKEKGVTGNGQQKYSEWFQKDLKKFRQDSEVLFNNGKFESTINSRSDSYTLPEKGGIGKIIREAFENHDSTLNLNSCRADTDDIRLIAEYLKENTSLVTLDLTNNNFGDKALEVLLVSLEKNKTLKTLILTNNNFSEMALIAFVKAIANNHTITDLKIDPPNLFDQGSITSVHPDVIPLGNILLVLPESNLQIENKKILKQFNNYISKILDRNKNEEIAKKNSEKQNTSPASYSDNTEYSDYVDMDIVSDNKNKEIPTANTEQNIFGTFISDHTENMVVEGREVIGGDN